MTITVQPTRLYCKKQLELTGVDEFFLGYFLFPYVVDPGKKLAELKPVMAQRSGQATGNKGIEKMKRGRTHDENVLRDMKGIFTLPAGTANAETSPCWWAGTKNRTKAVRSTASLKRVN
jgi:hypothetical protein